jgi:hypothetical protein
MAFVDLLRTTVLLAAGAATALAAITVISTDASDDTLTLYGAGAWWIAALIGGIILGSPSRAADAMRPVLTDARTATALPERGSTRAALARLWPLAAFAAVAGGLGLVYPGVAAVGTGFALGAALALRSREGAVAAIEERDGVRFYVQPGSALQPVKLVRTPGLRRDRPPPGSQPPPPPAAA